VQPLPLFHKKKTMTDEKIENIQKKLEQLSLKQVELEKTQQQRVKSHEEQKTLYHHLFGQPPLPPDPELQYVNSQIEDLKEQRRDYFKILQAAASVPPPVEEKDWSKSPLYSKTVQKLTGATTPFEQYGWSVWLNYWRSILDFSLSISLTPCDESNRIPSWL
jgi:hypothetical protein